MSSFKSLDHGTRSVGDCGIDSVLYLRRDWPIVERLGSSNRPPDRGVIPLIPEAPAERSTAEA